MGMGGQALPGVNAEKLSAPLPCPALLCLGDWQLPPPAACSQHGAWEQLPAPQSRHRLPHTWHLCFKSLCFIFPSALGASLNVRFLFWFLSVLSPQ